jgi:tetratricopeptide (TPR) repeat protein
MNRLERRAAARKSDKASRDTATPATLYETACVHAQAGRFVDAQTCCERALAIEPNHEAANYLAGLVAMQIGQNDRAIEWFVRAIKQTPKVEYLSGLGTALQCQGRLQEALKAFDKAASLESENGEHWKNLGGVLLDLDRPDEALLSLRQALHLRPQYVEAANLCGLILYRQNRFAEALEAFNLSLNASSDQADALHMRALVLQGQGRLEEAAADGLRSQTLDPANADTHNNLGYVLHKLRRYDESLTCYQQALSLRPDHILALKNKADLLADFLRFDEAMACYRTAATIAPSDPLITWNMALIHMVTGEFETGWKGREIRWKTGLGMAEPSFAQPQWSGSGPLEGKTVLIFADEGIGDSFQFARYIPMVAQLGAKVVLAVENSACPLLSRLSGVTECIPKSTSVLPAFDMHYAIGSLPLAFETTLDTIPATVPYLPAPLPARRAAWNSQLGPHDKLRVGLVWSGNPRNSNDQNRSLPLQQLAKILSVDAKFVSLQKGIRGSDQQVLSGLNVVDLTEQLSDFEETAALISCLDIVITVDTSVAHLAGGLGGPVWILLPYRPDYRWLLRREDSPWYPTARLFRQDEQRDYAPVIDRICGELAIEAEKFRNLQSELTQPIREPFIPRS